jgi:DNA (cytosine-5)-methyltransferase 1
LLPKRGGVGAKTGLYLVRPVLTPDRMVKRQNGRRMKNPGEDSFTLTSQDKHGIFISDK